MPSTPLEITAQWKDIEKPVITGVVNDDTNPDTDAITNPQTGDNSHMALWMALLFISGGLLTVTGVCSKKKHSAR